MAPHQERVILEKNELKERYDKLTIFLNGDLFKTLDVLEQARLRQQAFYMSGYLLALEERIENFK